MQLKKYWTYKNVSQDERTGEGSVKSDLANDPDMADLIDEFVAGLPAPMAALRETFANNHLEKTRRMAHQLKGAGGSYGYPSVTDAAKTLENAAKVGDVEAASLALGRLSNLSQAVTEGRGERGFNGRQITKTMIVDNGFGCAIQSSYNHRRAF